MKYMEYKKCKECLARYPDHQDYVHECDSLMKYLTQECRARNRAYKENKETK